MPPRDDTFYNIRRLHVVFAVASVALVAATVWMVAADHLRTWKVYQRTYRERVEPWLAATELRKEKSRDYLAAENQLEQTLDEAQAAVPDAALVERFCRALEQQAAALGLDADDEVTRVQSAYESLATTPGRQTHAALVAAVDRIVAKAQFQEDELDRKLKFRRAELDEARTGYESAVGQGLPPARLDAIQSEVDAVKQDVDSLAARREEAASRHRGLAAIREEITAPEDAAQKALAEHRASVARLDRSLAAAEPNLGKEILESPLLDALGRPLGVDQIWLPDLTIDYNFRQVPRFDRCRTCHQGIDRTAPDSPDRPAFAFERTATVQMATPTEPPHPADATKPTLQDVYGLTLAPRGVLQSDAATVGLVLAKTPAAMARLEPGDVIRRIAGHEIASPGDAARYLLGEVEWGQPLEIVVQRGLTQPYCSHPRLDLYVGSLSPHPAAEFGCTICHDGQGSATNFTYASHSPNTLAERARWRSEHDWRPNEFWDLPMLESRFSESRCLKCHHDVTDLEPSKRFPDPPAAKLVEGYNLVRQNGCFGCHEIRGVTDEGKRVGPDIRLEPKGSMRKVGTSLRHVADKLDATFLDAWNRNPADFRPQTRMPRFFGLDDHLSGKSLADAKRFEAVEIRAIDAYLLGASEPLPPLEPPQGVTEPPSVERGRTLFETQGCLGCHRHAEFPDAQSTFGPGLTNLGAKLTTAAGKAWLVDWIRDPARRSPSTLMPNPQLEPVPLAGDDAKLPDGKPRMSDPAADIAAWLLTSSDWRPAERRPLVESDLDELATMYLEKTFTRREAERYLAEGIPESMAGDVPADEAELIGPVTQAKKLRYVGRRTIRKRGCFGCHDIPGFEDAQPIGPALSDWGRKQESLLAFEQVARFLAVEDRKIDDGETTADRAFFEEAVREGRREGFAWQKLRAPRSFDYKKAENKGYNERLLMGKFSFTPGQREAIITFLLGLVADPPAAKYVYQPDRTTGAIVEGRKVLDKYGCAQCHTLSLERWQFEYDPDEYIPPPATPDFAFLQPQFSDQQIAASLATDNRGMAHAEVVGMPRLDASGDPIEDVDDDDNPLYFFTLWEPEAIAGEVCAPGGADVMISEPQITLRRPPEGGAMVRLLFPTALARARAEGSSATDMEAFGWLPPALAHEGAKVRPEWLYQYLLNPTPIRPAAIMRMPKYNLSPGEAASLVDYFAAASAADFPYTPTSPLPQAGEGPGARVSGNAGLPAGNRFDQAMKLLTDRVTFCAKCHQIGDYSPGDAVRTTLAPDLGQVGGRIRPDYLRRWLASPKSALPYTGMPVNFPPQGEPLGQDLLPGPSIEQIDTVESLLLHYDQYIKSRTSIRKMVESPASE